jgi:tetratricopeptide (TPR) repeat protein
LLLRRRWPTGKATWRLGLEGANGGRYEEAERNLKNALDETEKFEPNDPRVAETLNALVGVYRDQRKYPQAEPLAIRLLAAREKVFGSEHPVVGALLNDLALLYYAEGKYAEAEPLYKRSLAILEKALGPDHPDVAISLEHYAALLRKTNREAEAEDLQARARTIRAKQDSRGAPK